MKKPLLLTVCLMITFTLFANTYRFPKKIRPALSLKEACEIANKMLKTQGDEKQYFILSVTLNGNKEQDGWGAWNIWYYDLEGNEINAYIPFPTGEPGLHYYIYDKSKPRSEPRKEKTVNFIRKGLNITLKVHNIEIDKRKQKN